MGCPHYYWHICLACCKHRCVYHQTCHSSHILTLQSVTNITSTHTEVRNHRMCRQKKLISLYIYKAVQGIMRPKSCVIGYGLCLHDNKSSYIVNLWAARGVHRIHTHIAVIVMGAPSLYTLQDEDEEAERPLVAAGTRTRELHTHTQCRQGVHSLHPTHYHTCCTQLWLVRLQQ